jgi:hypothetical protein
VVPWQALVRPDIPAGNLAYNFLQANPASLFYPAASSPPATASKHARVSKRRLRSAVKAAKQRTAGFRSARARKLHNFLLRQAHETKAGTR